MNKSKMNTLIIFSLLLTTFSCVSPPVSTVATNDYLSYQPIDPQPVSKVMVFDNAANAMTEVYWRSIDDEDQVRSYLPLQSAIVSVSKTDQDGKVTYATASLSGSKGTYDVIMDYMKYRVEDVYGSSGEFLGNGRIGVGLRIKANVVTTKKNLNLGSIASIGAEANQNNITGGISVDIIGIDSKDVTNLVPLTSEIDQTSIQSALQALAAIKTKLWEDDTDITPHLIAIRQAKPNTSDQIREMFVDNTFEFDSYSESILSFWKPDGQSIDSSNEQKIINWMSQNGLNTEAGAITMFINGEGFQSLRKKFSEDILNQ